MPELFFEKMAIVGVGLIGGSLALSLREKGVVREIVGIGRGAENLKRGLDKGAIDRYTHSPEEGCNGADVVIMAPPVGAIPDLLKRIKPALKDSTIVTDVGSVKGWIIREIEAAGLETENFVPAHPIAGGEKSGVEAAFPELFVGKKCVLTPTERTNSLALERIKAMWELVGADVVLMDPDRHDRILGVTSHLPHMVAYALANTIGDYDQAGYEVLKFIGTGFKDTTRIAASHPVMWRDISMYNREAIVQSVKDFENTLKKIRRCLEKGEGEELEKDFSRAQNLRDSLS